MGGPWAWQGALLTQMPQVLTSNIVTEPGAKLNNKVGVSEVLKWNISPFYFHSGMFNLHLFWGLILKLGFFFLKRL